MGDMTSSVFGANLKKYREAAGISGNELARRTGLDQSLISKMETGGRGPSVSVIQTIADKGGIGATLGELQSWAKADRVLREISELPRDRWSEVLKDVETILKKRGIE